jgi:hypothetical protein
MKSLLFLTLGFLFLASIQADTMSYVVEFTGATCTLCGVTNFDYCTSGTNASASFFDPLPSGSVLNQVSLTTTAMYWCETDAYLNWYIQNAMITQGMTNEYNCVCNQCPPTVTATSSYYGNGLPGYGYGNYNELTVANLGESGSVGVAQITLVLTYNSGGGGGNNATVTVPYAGCGFCNLCGSTTYALSNGGTDCGEGTWDDGFQYFMDPSPSGSKVVQVTVFTSAMFWCEGPAQANFTVAGTYVGTSEVMEHECQCNSCPGVQAIASEMYDNGFPGYMQGSENYVQVNAVSGVVGVGKLTVVVTYTEMGSTVLKEAVAK